MSGSGLIVDRRGVARYRGRLLPCAIGRGGITAEKREGDGGSPVGSWRVEFGWYRADRMAAPASAIPFRAAGARDGWSDDPADAAYNAPVTLPQTCSHERMRRGDRLYDLVLVLNHNRAPAIPGEGSAIFVHCWRAPRLPTAGCIAFPPRVLRWIIATWQPRRDRVIIRP